MGGTTRRTATTIRARSITPVATVKMALSHAQEAASILGVPDSHRVPKVRAAGRTGERCRGNVFRDPVAADRSDNGQEQHEPPGPSACHVH